MSKGYYKDVIALLKEGGLVLERHGKGSHEIWKNPKTGCKVTVSRNLPIRHVANAILKDAGLANKQFGPNRPKQPTSVKMHTSKRSTASRNGSSRKKTTKAKRSGTAKGAGKPGQRLDD